MKRLPEDHIVNVIKGILAEAGEKLGCYGIHDLNGICVWLGRSLPWNVSFVYEAQVSELDRYGLFVSVCPESGVRTFWLNSEWRDEENEEGGVA